MRRVDPCPFCRPDRPTICEGEHAIAIHDAFPVARGHALVLPRWRGDADDPRGESGCCFPRAGGSYRHGSKLAQVSPS